VLVLPDLELLLAIPEHKTALPGDQRASQTDLLVLAKSNDRLVVIGVEGKVNEPFDRTLAARHRSAGRAGAESGWRSSSMKNSARVHPKNRKA
jgi:hypothetical protein